MMKLNMSAIRGYGSHLRYNLQLSWLHVRRALWHLYHAIVPVSKECPIVLTTLDDDKVLDGTIEQQYSVVKAASIHRQRLYATLVLRFLRELRYNRKLYKR